jgi:hypothetical protein
MDGNKILKARILADWDRLKRLILLKRSGKISRRHFVCSWEKLQRKRNHAEKRG